jgi:hypothetical protein
MSAQRKTLPGIEPKSDAARVKTAPGLGGRSDVAQARAVLEGGGASAPRDEAASGPATDATPAAAQQGEVTGERRRDSEAPKSGVRLAMPASGAPSSLRPSAPPRPASVPPAPNALRVSAPAKARTSSLPPPSGVASGARDAARSVSVPPRPATASKPPPPLRSSAPPPRPRAADPSSGLEARAVALDPSELVADEIDPLETARREPPRSSPPPAPPSRRAAVRPRLPRGSVLPPAPPRPSAPVGAEAPPSHVEIPKPTPSSQIRSLVSTAQDWPRVRAPFPSRPSFGDVRGPLRSLPAFLPPAGLDAGGLVGLPLEVMGPAMSPSNDVTASIDAPAIVPGGAADLAAVSDAVSSTLDLARLDAAMQEDAQLAEPPSDTSFDDPFAGDRARRKKLLVIGLAALSLALAFVLGVAMSR